MSTAMKIRLASALAVSCATVAAFAPAAAAPAQGALAVTGFQSSGDSPAVIDRSAGAMSTVGVDGINVTRSGQGVSAVGGPARKQLARAHSDGLQAQLLIGNFDNSIGDFSEPVAHRLFAKRSRIDAVAKRLGHIVKTQGWDGAMIDFESMSGRDRSGLDRFAKAVRAALPGNASLSIAVQNSNTRQGYRALGYDLRSIAKTVDTMTLMTYDQHGPWENRPGPIGALGWQQRGLETALRKVPASKLDLGVAGYGYAWRPHSNDTLTVAEARKLAGRRAHWNSRVGEWTATLRDGSTVWFADARSYRKRAALAERYGLHGLALWSLGQADPIPAQAR